jgi:hypothetical protein
MSVLATLSDGILPGARVGVSPLHGGMQALVLFPNGYGASIVDHSFSYGVELAVIRGADFESYELAYDTPVTNDIIGYIPDADSLAGYLDEIRAL